MTNPTRHHLIFIFKLCFTAVVAYTISECSGLFSVHLCALLKALPAILCAICIYKLKQTAQMKEKIRHNAPSRYCLPIMVGLLLCAGGDFFLRLDQSAAAAVDNNTPSPYFLCGLVSFLIGHLMFIVAFWLDGGNGMQIKWGVGIVVYIAVYLRYLLTNIADDDMVLKVGVCVYCVAIGTMLHRSLSLSFDAYPRVESTLYATLGSAFFVVSDSILAYDRFISPVPFAYIWVLGTYFPAIAFIASSCAGTNRWSAGWE